MKRLTCAALVFAQGLTMAPIARAGEGAGCEPFKVSVIEMQAAAGSLPAGASEGFSAVGPRAYIDGYLRPLVANGRIARRTDVVFKGDPGAGMDLAGGVDEATASPFPLAAGRVAPSSCTSELAQFKLQMEVDIALPAEFRNDPRLPGWAAENNKLERVRWKAKVPMRLNPGASAIFAFVAKLTEDNRLIWIMLVER